METLLLKKLALMQFLNEPYFVKNDIAYIGEKEDYEDLSEAEIIEPLIKEDDEYVNHICLTNEEADDKCHANIKQSVWAFNSDFIIKHTDLTYESQEMVKSFCEKQCESANDTILAMIKDFNEFEEDAISEDGRGHFMSTYDGQENEITLSSGEIFYIYKIR